jgi:hypothetical protein
LPETFGKLSFLEKINIDNEKMTALPKSIGKCSNLRQIYLNCDNLTELPSSMRNLKNLEEFSIYAFNLKKIPDVFGNLTSLKLLDIFSGVLTAFPESLWNLKKLKDLTLDAYHVNKLPESFKKLSYVKNQNIHIGKREPGRNQIGRSTAGLKFDELAYMNYQYRWKILERYSLKELEAMLCSAPHEYEATQIDKAIVKDILRERLCRLNRKFSWTPENIQRIAKVSDAFLAAWEAGFKKAKSIIDILYKRERDKDNFWDNYDGEIILHPNILVMDKTGEWNSCGGVYSVLVDSLPERDLSINISGREYDPATKDEKGFREGIHINHDLSWNIEGFGDIDLQDHYICYALHILYSHNEWANEDILKINNIDSEVKIIHRNSGEVF